MVLPAAAGGATVLVVEDDPVQGEAAADVLRREGYHVLPVARTRDAALRSVAADRPDIVLMDIVLGQTHDGIEAAKDISERFAIPVIYLSAHDDVETLRASAPGHPYGFLVKPLRPSTLRAAIEVALDRHAEQAGLRADLAHAKGILDAVLDPVVAVDPAGIVRYMNRAGAEWALCPPQTAVGRPVTEVLDVDSHGSSAILLAAIQRTLAVHAAIRLPRRTTIRTPAGRFPIAGVATPMAKPEGGVLFAFRDLAREKQMGSLEADALSMAMRLEAATST